jgi:hypothetical protein
MVKDRLRKIYTSKAFYIVFSILASVTIWLYISYIEDPDKTVTIKGIKVEFLNGDYVTERGLVITHIETSTLTLGFRGRRNTVTKLSSTNVSATVDLSEIKSTGVYQLDYDIVYPIDFNASAVTISSRSASFIQVTVDNLVKKDIPVYGSFNGSVAEGYQADPLELAPSVITVSGPQEIIKKIASAWVYVSRENLSKTVEDNLPFKLMDEDGNQINSDKLVFSQNTIHVTVRVKKVKEVPLTVTYITGAGADESNTVAVIKPATITVAGDAETLDGYNQIVLGTVDLTKFESTTTLTFPIVLPNDTTNLTGTTEAEVTITVSGLESTSLRATNIDTINTPAGYATTVVTKDLNVLLRGREEELRRVRPSNIRIVADLSGLGATTGTYSVPAKVYVDGGFETVGAIGEYKVTVKLEKD